MDYCFPGDEFDRLIVLVVIERYTKMKKAVVVPSKGLLRWSSSSSTSAGTRSRTSS